MRTKKTMKVKEEEEEAKTFQRIQVSSLSNRFLYSLFFFTFANTKYERMKKKK